MSPNAAGALLLAALAALVCSHVALLVRLARARSWRHFVAALVVPPLAPLWAWELKERRWIYTWLVALAVYTAGAVALALTR